ncbi:MAG: DNA polymerase IV [Candidatus Krumholzibacteriia bacterium]
MPDRPESARSLRDGVQAPRAIIHVDMDAFYASVEMLDEPSLRGRPVIVGGTPEGRGVVAAASYEARRFGVHSAMSAARARRLCPGGVFLRPRMARYAEVSEQVFAVFAAFTPLVEPLSIDEAFLDVTGCQRLFGPAVAIGRAIKARIGAEVGLAASVGIAPNKFLAKLASELEKPDGFVVIEQAEAAARGVRRVRDLLACDADALAALLGRHAHGLRELALGLDDRPVVPDAGAKSIGAETTFARDIADEQRLREELHELVERVGRRLRAAGLRARTVQLKARYPDFTTVTRAVTLPSPTARTPELRAAAHDLLTRRLGRRGRPLRLVGITVAGFEAAAAAAPELFADPAAARTETVDHLLDTLQDRFGNGAIRRGARRRPPGGAGGA